MGCFWFAFKGPIGDVSSIGRTSERYDDMCKVIKALIEQGVKLTVEEETFSLLHTKTLLGARRAAWRTINLDAATPEERDLLEKYKNQIEDELDLICKEILDLLQEKLIPQECDEEGDESEVFYLKMAGDYYRYLSEFRPDEAKMDAEKMYKRAYQVAGEKLHETHPTRLGLALNFSVCYYEILKQPDAACAPAKEAFDDAIQKLDSLDDASYKDSTLIMQLLRDNLTLWTSDQDNDAPDGGPDDKD
eukprot:TRINITY_DN2015_c0_g1_i1.p1 TRINITY_DN2015_c0_g1~~TRINITY_DN2015_c0_g1_i1.p1  ORF type:complete len:247 (-),score=41.99 TRINITY_DN2015_c0_g1_i1:95-835(-)